MEIKGGNYIVFHVGLRKHLEIEFEEKQNHQIYWDDVAMFCYTNEYRLGIRKMQKSDIIEIDSLSELVEIDESYKVYLNGGIEE